MEDRFEIATEKTEEGCSICIERNTSPKAMISPFDVADLIAQIDRADPYWRLKVANVIKGYTHGIKADEASRVINHMRGGLWTSNYYINDLENLSLGNLDTIVELIPAFLKAYKSDMKDASNRRDMHRDLCCNWFDSEACKLLHTYDPKIKCTCWKHDFTDKRPTSDAPCSATVGRFKSGDKVTFDGEIYDFGYYIDPLSGVGRCVLYEKRCRNMQDSISVLDNEVKYAKV